DGLGENKKGVSDAYKESYDVGNDCNGVFRFGCGNEAEVGTSKCTLNMEQVKEIWEMVGVSWVLAEEENKRGDQIRGGSSAEGNVEQRLQYGKNWGLDQLLEMNIQMGPKSDMGCGSFLCKKAIGDERFKAVRGSWNGKDEEVFLEASGDPYGGRKFTRVSDDGVKFSKLDRFLLNDDFNNLWGNLSVVALDRKLSDHYPIVLKDVDQDFGPKPFSVFNVWMDEPDSYQVVEDAWKKEVRSYQPNCIFQDRLKNVKASLRGWSKERFGGNKKKIESLRSEAIRWELEEEKRTLDNNERLVWLEARKIWEDKENEYCNMLHQKTRIKWDAEGDKNYKFFHSFVKRRNNKCNLRGLMVDGVWCKDPKVIKAEMARHYKKLFSESRVWDAIRVCGGDKAPGPDAFNFKFIRKMWDIIKPELVGAIGWFWDNMEISKGCNASFVTIIPKVADPIGLGDFRPISLIGCYYKIIAKMLAERVKRVVGIVVGEAQNAFIKGKFILDGVLIANETMEFLKENKRKSLIFKVDLEKAYDNINWRFLIDNMKKMGFRNKKEGESIWARVIKSIHGEGGASGDVRPMGGGEGGEVWRDIVKSGEEIYGLEWSSLLRLLGWWGIGGIIGFG
ncbi:transposon TX1, partial [Tanacetum coccineum]